MSLVGMTIAAQGANQPGRHVRITEVAHKQRRPRDWIHRQQVDANHNPFPGQDVTLPFTVPDSAPTQHVHSTN